MDMRTTTTNDVSLVSPDDHPAVSAALAGAFQDDPVFAWIFPGDERRAAILPGVFDAFTAGIAPLGASHVTATGAGAALWFPPGVGMSDEADEAMGAAIASVPGVTDDDMQRTAVCMTVLGEAHPHDPCWYLNLLGVGPAHQGGGIGSALLQAGSARSEADGVPAYLEATSPDNRRLYERHGYVVERELQLPGGPPLWAMWRHPFAV